MPRLQGRMPDLRRTATRRRPDLPNQDVARTILVLLLLLLAGAAIPLAGQTSPPFEVSTPTVKLTDLRVSAHMIRADLSRLQPRLGLAHGRVGQTQELADLARKAGALAAINGSYFEAYTASAIKNPNHTLFHEGRVVAKGNIGSVLGFAADGRARIEPLRLKIEGALDGSFRYPDNWHAYWVNRLPEGAPTITLFTPDWGPRTGLSDGVQVVVSGGRVTHLVSCPLFPTWSPRAPGHVPSQQTASWSTSGVNGNRGWRNASGSAAPVHGAWSATTGPHWASGRRSSRGSVQAPAWSGREEWTFRPRTRGSRIPRSPRPGTRLAAWWGSTGTGAC